MVEIFLGVNLLGIILIGYAVSRLSDRIDSIASVDPQKLQKSLNKSVQKQIQQSFAAPVDVSAFIEHTIQQLQKGQQVTTHSNLEREIVYVIARDVFGEQYIQWEDQYAQEPGSRNLICKSTNFYLQEAS